MTVKTQPNPLDLMTAGASKASLGSVISPKKLSELQWKKKKSHGIINTPDMFI